MGTRGSNGKFLSKSEQLQVILNSNAAEDDYHTWIRMG